MVVCFNRSSILTLIIRVGMHNDLPIAQPVGMQENGIVQDKQSEDHDQQPGDLLGYAIFECHFHLTLMRYEGQKVQKYKY